MAFHTILMAEAPVAISVVWRYTDVLSGLVRWNAYVPADRQTFLDIPANGTWDLTQGRHIGDNVTETVAFNFMP